MAQHPFISGRWLKHNKLQENENWHISRNHQNEVTSFCYISTKKIKSIFLGSFPIYQMSEGKNQNDLIEFYYGSNDNKFWPLLSRLLTFPIDTIQSRIDLLNLFSIGITDILLDIKRYPDNSNSDKDLFPFKYNDILELLNNYPLIKNIFITSGGVAGVAKLNSKNKSVATWLRDSIIHKNPKGFNYHGFVKNIIINSLNFNLIYLYSPSDNENIPIQGILNRNNNFDIPNLNIELFREYQWEYFLKKYHFNQEPKVPQPLMDFFEQ